MIGDAWQGLQRKDGCCMSEEDLKERQELEAAGWEPVGRGGGGTVWRNPESGYLYPQGIAISFVREGAELDVPLEPEGDA